VFVGVCRTARDALHVMTCAALPVMWARDCRHVVWTMRNAHALQNVTCRVWTVSFVDLTAMSALCMFRSSAVTLAQSKLRLPHGIRIIRLCPIQPGPVSWIYCLHQRHQCT
jgi:hypothetical protein